jgi:CheY-like chemotaxis protein
MNDIELKTILLVEDEAIIALVEKKTLEKLGYNVIHASSGEKAVDIVKAGTRVDLILMDIDLGSGIDGTTAAEMILGTRDIPLVFLSSHTEPEIVEKTEGITSYGYIVKNSGETVLSAAIRMAFRLFEAKLKVQSHLNQQEVLVDILLEFHKRMNHPFEELMDYAIEVSLKLTESAFSFAGLMNEDESVMTIHAWSAGAMESCSIDKTPIKFPIPEAGVWGECLRQRKPVIMIMPGKTVIRKGMCP